MSATPQLTRGLGLFSAMAVNVGNMIGTGVFLKTRVMTCNVGASSTVIAVWILGGLLVLAGAFAYSEVASMTPEAGGEYVYVRRAYGRFASFLCGWTFFTLASAGSQAALAVGFAIFVNVATGGALTHELFSFSVAGHMFKVTWMPLVAAAAIWIIAALNSRPVERGGANVLWLTSIKVAFLLLLALVALLFGHGDFRHLTEHNVGGVCEGVGASARGGLAGFGAALLGVVWAYDGWRNVAPLLGEIKNPERNVSRAFLWGVLLVASLYVLVAVSYFYVLSPTEVANVSSTSSVGTEVLRRFVGPAAVTAIALVLMLSAFGSQQANALSNARVGFAMARDGVFFRPLGLLSSGNVPVNATIAQAGWATVLALSGTFDTLTDAAMFGSWLFYGLTVSSVFVLRAREPDAPRPYRSPGHPYVSALFLLVTLGIIVNAFIATPRQAILGAGLMLLGVPVYLYCTRLARAAAQPA